ncbi:NPCBM/NEW2 domain-containing protein [Kocuria rosea]|uniref:NPCBM/NEW2 domain-containing protein n=1 Tax=Kocuria rosea TaxID=1275 RepID=UPI003A5C7DD0
MVNPAMTRFQAIAGVDDSSENTSLQVRFTAYDATTGRELHAVDASYQNPVPFDINIEGVRRLGLRVKSVSATESLWDSPAVVAWAEPIIK